MTKLEERIRTGLHETAKRIPERGGTHPLTKPGRRTGIFAAVVAALTVLVLFSPLAFILGSDPAKTSAIQDPVGGSDVVPAQVGFEFARPEHVRLRFTQDLILECGGMETIDSGGFDSFDLDIWIDHRSGYTRLGFDYPDGSSHDLILRGRPGAWEYAWGSGVDRGRDAGCRETLGAESYEESVVGWAFQDSSELWFTAYLKPVSPDDKGVSIYHDGRPTPASITEAETYLIETNPVSGGQSRFEFTLDEDEIRVVAEERYHYEPNHFEATATIEVLESGPTELPVGIFDTSAFTPLWGDPSVVTTGGTP